LSPTIYEWNILLYDSGVVTSMYFCGNEYKELAYILNWAKQQLPPKSLQKNTKKMKLLENIMNLSTRYIFSFTSISFESKLPNKNSFNLQRALLNI
jgi:hypothetical protein